MCAVDRGDFASIDRGYSHEHSAFHTNNTPSRVHDRGYVRAQSRACIAVQPSARLYWHTLDRDFQEALELADEEIRRRLTILVMIDVATRMPLAWVVSEQPKAEATIALLRMATRDKTREKRIYGCDGDPMPALGLGLVRNDNGTGLRNKQVKEILMATAAANVDVRAYASADKPYVERRFGTAESVLWKLVHGYAGRKPGENPGYDAKKMGFWILISSMPS